MSDVPETGPHFDQWWETKGCEMAAQVYSAREISEAAWEAALRHQSGTKPTCDPQKETARLDLWNRFAVHGGPQGSFMLYPGFRDALRECIPQVCNMPAPDFDSWFKARPVQTPLSYTAVERALREAWDAALQSVAGKKP